MDELRSWGDGILVWCNVVRTNPPLKLGINGRYLPFIVNIKDNDYNSYMFSMSQHLSAKSSSGEEFLFQKTNCYVRCTGAVRCWFGVSKEEGDKCMHAVCGFMAENATKPAFDGKKSVYEVFKNSSHSNSVDVLEYKYMFCKALETKLLVEKMIACWLSAPPICSHKQY
eukprot:14492239-Ditylum_brightwellii.AAC.1